jgi:hypothetical protein
MKTVSFIVAFLLCAVIIAFISIGGSFDRAFWLAFLPGFTGNIIILAIALFVIDRIFRQERVHLLRETNTGKSQFVRLLANRMAYLLLEYLQLVGKGDVHRDPEMYFQFAVEKLRAINLTTTFYEQLVRTADKEKFAGGFAKIVERESQGISKGLESIYPRPDSKLEQMAHQLLEASGAVSAFSSVFRAINETNAQLDESERFSKDQQDLLGKVSFIELQPQLQLVQAYILEISDRANTNSLFMQFE